MSKKWWLVGAAVIIAAAGAGEAVGFWLSPQDGLQKSDAIVAISGGDTTARVDEAVKLYRAGWAQHIIFSGAALDPTGPSNASAMRVAAVKQGVPDEAIWLDESAVNTVGNALGVKKLADQHHLSRIVLVTSPYHQRRASLTFADALGQNVQIINHSTTDQSWRRALWWDNPTSIALTWSELKKTLYVLIAGPHKITTGQ